MNKDDQDKVKQLVEIKADIVAQLNPLIEDKDADPEQRFILALESVRNTNDPAAVKKAFAVAQEIKDTDVKANALLDLLNEVDLSINATVRPDFGEAEDDEVTDENPPSESNIDESSSEVPPPEADEPSLDEQTEDEQAVDVEVPNDGEPGDDHAEELPPADTEEANSSTDEAAVEVQPDEAAAA